MQAGYVKLFSRLLTSPVWSLDDQTRLVWITMLVASDMQGVVDATIPGIARLAAVPIEAVERAVGLLSQPDPYSTSKNEDGARIKKIDDGHWLVVNRNAYRDSWTKEDRREYQKKWKRDDRARKAAKRAQHESVSTCVDRSTQSIEV